MLDGSLALDTTLFWPILIVMVSENWPLLNVETKLPLDRLCNVKPVFIAVEDNSEPET